MTKEAIELPSIREFMSQHIHRVPPTANLEEILHFFMDRAEENIPLAVIEPTTEEFLGLITERECLEFLSNEIFYGSPDVSVRSLYSRVPLCLTPDTDIFTVSNVFIQHPCRYLPVVEDKHLLGVASRPLVLRGLYECHRKMLETKRQQKVCPNFHELASHRFILSRHR